MTKNILRTRAGVAGTVVIASALLFGTFVDARPPATGPAKPAPGRKEPAKKDEAKETLHIYAMKPVLASMNLKQGSSKSKLKSKREKIGTEIDMRDLEDHLQAITKNLVVSFSKGRTKTEVEIQDTDIAIKGPPDVHAAMQQLIDAMMNPVIPGQERPAKPAVKPKPAPATRPGGKAPPASAPVEEESKTVIVAYSIAHLPASASGLRIKNDTEIRDVLEALTERIKTEVVPKEWGVNDGDLHIFGGELIVRQSPENQKAVEAFLKTLTKEQPAQGDD